MNRGSKLGDIEVIPRGRGIGESGGNGTEVFGLEIDQ